MPSLPPAQPVLRRLLPLGAALLLAASPAPADPPLGWSLAAECSTLKIEYAVVEPASPERRELVRLRVTNGDPKEIAVAFEVRFVSRRGQVTVEREPGTGRLNGGRSYEKDFTPFDHGIPVAGFEVLDIRWATWAKILEGHEGSSVYRGLPAAVAEGKATRCAGRVVALAGGLDRMLLDASDRGAPAPVRALLEAGASPDAKEKDGWSALMYASAKGHVEVVDALLHRGARPDARRDEGLTALMDAASAGHVEVVKRLLAGKADPNARSETGLTALKVARLRGHAQVVALLTQAGATG